MKKWAEHSKDIIFLEAILCIFIKSFNKIVLAIAGNRRIGNSHSNCIYVQCWFLLQEMAIILVVESKTGRDDSKLR